MAKFWFVSAPLYSHTDWGGFLKTAQELVVQGHDIVWVSGRVIDKAIMNRGLPFHAIEETGWLWPPPPQPNVSQLAPQEAINLRYKRALDTWLSEDIVATATQCLIDLSREIGQPDAIVTDPFLSASALAAEALGVPMIVCGWPAQDDLNALDLFPVQRDLGEDSQQRITRLCDQFGLQGINFSKGPTPAIISPHLHVCYFTADWYLADTLLPQNLFVGGSKTPSQGDIPKWFAQLPEDVLLGVVTLGTTFTGDLGFFSWGAQALAREGIVPIVVIGYNPIELEKKRELIAALPKGTRVLNWIPFDHVLPHIHIIIHHGGMGTTHQAIVHGIPQIVVPHAADQRVQARRVAQAKVGLNLSAHDVRQGMLWEGVHALAHDDMVRGTAACLQSKMASLGGAARAAEAIVSYSS